MEFTAVPKLKDVSWERSVLLYGMEFLYGNSREGEKQGKRGENGLRLTEKAKTRWKRMGVFLFFRGGGGVILERFSIS